MIQAQAAAVDLVAAGTGLGLARGGRNREARLRDPRTRICADPAWSPRRRRAARRRERAETLAALAEGSMGLTGNLAGFRALTEGASLDAAMAAFGAPATAGDPQGLRRTRAPRSSACRGPRDSGAPARARRPLRGARRRGRLASQPGDPADRPEPAWFRSYRIPSAFALADGATPGRNGARPLCGGRPPVSRMRSDRSLGHGQSQERRRTDRSGACADRRAPALRRLWPACRREPHPARDARPPAGGHRGHASPASSATCCRCRSACWRRLATSPQAQTSRMR